MIKAYHRVNNDKDKRLLLWNRIGSWEEFKKIAINLSLSIYEMPTFEIKSHLHHLDLIKIISPCQPIRQEFDCFVSHFFLCNPKNKTALRQKGDRVVIIK